MPQQHQQEEDFIYSVCVHSHNHLKKKNPGCLLCFTSRLRQRGNVSAVTPNRTRSVYSHLEVSVYYALLMAILHRRHNLPSDGLMVEDTGREGRRREERQKQHEPLRSEMI